MNPSHTHHTNQLVIADWFLLTVYDILPGSQYYRYRNKTLEEGFPKRISQGFSGIPAYLAAAVVLNEKIYFIKKSRFYIFSPSESPPVKGLFILISVSPPRLSL